MSRGFVYLRGRTWWIKFYREGRPFYESSGSHDRAEAERLLQERTLPAPRQLFGQCLACGADQVRVLRTA